MADSKHPSKTKLTITRPVNQRSPNEASPKQNPSPVGDFSNTDKDYSKWSGISPEEVNKLHSRDDVDKSSFAHHHTLGPKRGQASPGDHVHDGRNSKKIAQGLGYSISGAKGSNAALASLITLLGNFIDFKDNTTA